MDKLYKSSFTFGRDNLLPTPYICALFQKYISIEIASKGTRKKSESQMGFEPTPLCDLVGRSNHWATADSMVSSILFANIHIHAQL